MDKSHEPFIDFGYRNNPKKTAYDNILEDINPSTKDLLIKEMPHFIIKEEVYKELADLVDHPILINFRNPQLALESRIKVFLESTKIKPRIETQRWLYDYVKGFIGQEDSLKNKLVDDSFYNFFEEINPLNVSNEPNKELQDRLLDFYSNTKGYNSWEEMLKESYQEQSYVKFGDILKHDKKRFSLKDIGWEAMDEIVNYLSIIKCDEMIFVDNSNFRADPKTYLRRITDCWGLIYDERSLSWDNSQKNSGNQSREQDLLWYNTLNNSNGIKPPLKNIPTVESFPLFLQEYLNDVAIPIYNEFLKKEHKHEKVLYS
jgi:hypothetical protein